jgi:hypothetical protein
MRWWISLSSARLPTKSQLRRGHLGRRDHGAGRDRLVELDVRRVSENVLVQALERRRGINPELAVQHAAQLVKGLKSRRLPVRPVEGQHQLRMQILIERILPGKPAQLAGQALVPAELQIRVDAQDQVLAHALI